jgi:predicted metalloprotease
MTHPQTLHLRETPAEPSRHEPTRRVALAVILLLLLLTALIAGGLKLLLPTGVEPVTVDHRPGDFDDVAQATRHSLEQYWEDEFPSVYGDEFAPLENGYQPKTADSPPWTCGGEKVTYQDLRGNAFYCGGSDDDYIAYDAELLFPRLNERFGSIAPTIVLAHEMGHAVQARAGIQAPSVVIELQADCFAGAWTRYAQSSGSDPVTWQRADWTVQSAPSWSCATSQERPQRCPRPMASGSTGSTPSRPVGSRVARDAPTFPTAVS